MTRKLRNNWNPLFWRSKFIELFIVSLRKYHTNLREVFLQGNSVTGSNK
ncbi:MAG: hypothetical protein ABSF64_32760 [Bryobacteraceae bacterium]